MQQLDADGDGLLSLSEFSSRPVVPGSDAASLGRAFARADVDRDGSLAKHEVFALLDPTSEPYCRLHAARLLRRCDADGDGALDAAEFAACPAHDGKEVDEYGVNAEAQAWPLFPQQFFHAVW